MFRVKDAKKSLDFYQNKLGMELLHEAPGGDFTNYFLAFPEPGFESLSKEEKSARKWQREGVLELCHNWGTEKDEKFKYANGNEEPGRGFGHICYSVDSLEEECARLEKLDVQFKKKPHEGRMRHIAFILDPDNYWIEIVNNAPPKDAGL
ncbi:lactoylglutathione lyase [Sporobolomyces salmoneus]|uniref:lactoylglutathione lyase n=1 Tax=Sporobolomyces salmoneus TaxID=183962 RepID=UPI00316FFCD8